MAADRRDNTPQEVTADSQVARLFSWRRGFNAMHLIDLGIRLGSSRRSWIPPIPPLELIAEITHGPAKFIAVDKQPNHQTMQRFRDHRLLERVCLCGGGCSCTLISQRWYKTPSTAGSQSQAYPATSASAGWLYPAARALAGVPPES